MDCLSRLNGMFAFALYDIKSRQLFLARDRLGVKPLFHARLSDGSLIFGSELKALLAHPGMLRRDVDPLAIEDYLAWGYVPDHRSMLRGVEKLPAGHFLLLECGKPMPEPRQYWDVDFSHRHKGSAEELGEQLTALMRDAVKSRMVADVPLGAFLSGGVDSSSVVALMAGKQPSEPCAPARSASMSARWTKAAMPKRLPGALPPTIARALYRPMTGHWWTSLRRCLTSPLPMLRRCRHSGCANWRAKA